MVMTIETFRRMLKSIRNIYGKDWRSDLEEDQEAMCSYLGICQSLIPDELADDMIIKYGLNRPRAPYSPCDILNTYIVDKIKDAKSSFYIIDKIVEAKKKYSNIDEPKFDEYIFNNVIPVFPCSNGVKEFYIKNKRKLNRLALYTPPKEEQEKIYEELDEIYGKQLFMAEKDAIIRMIDIDTLPDNKKYDQLEG